ncbi:related to kelch repeat-containing proteins [Ramularia collo-cygni]|uniref:Related to kelch repeat-containing proteins n=1 Tax=Ramularia collo-cygni TaxID=112498 RepID=A0A2D3V2S6_9PEZI|nr:related to kelch repeat-containing proteins [Ramularia collo-cygni]CZT14573.1 related to kelch repeat-containing proteins [Ramularia collo-cygni]
MADITASWTKVATAEQLQRSSHNVSAIGGSLFVFGGELKPREPRDNDLHKVDLEGRDATKPVQSIQGNASSPAPRVGAATAKIGHVMYMFSGRGGPEMTPVDEHGALWSLDTTSNEWKLLKPTSAVKPEARSFHALTSDDKDTIYLHAGCPEKGRLADLWSFNLSTSSWKQLATAPGPSRGGASIAFADGKLYRMNGFDGEKEQGGALDVYSPESNSWETTVFPADGKTGPGARSVAALVPVSIQGSTSLVTLFGESDPSSLGHQGAGKMLSDIWAYSIGTGRWSPVLTQDEALPNARGWFDADVVSINGKDRIAVAGGLGESNERLNDLWVLSF